MNETIKTLEEWGKVADRTIDSVKSSLDECKKSTERKCRNSARRIISLGADINFLLILVAVVGIISALITSQWLLVSVLTILNLAMIFVIVRDPVSKLVTEAKNCCNNECGTKTACGGGCVCPTSSISTLKRVTIQFINRLKDKYNSIIIEMQGRLDNMEIAYKELEVKLEQTKATKKAPAKKATTKKAPAKKAPKKKK